MASAAMPQRAAQRLLPLRRGISTQRIPLAAQTAASSCTPRSAGPRAAAASAATPAAAFTAGAGAGAATTASSFSTFSSFPPRSLLLLSSSSSSSTAVAACGGRRRSSSSIATGYATAATARTAAPHPSSPLLRAAALAGRRLPGGNPGKLRRFSSSKDPRDESDAPNSRIWSFDEINKLVKNPRQAKNVVIIDVREPGELLETGRIPGAINIPITTAVQSFHISDPDFEDMYGFERPPKDAHLLFYCRAGVRARSAAGLAHHAGWQNVGEYPGSWLDWETHGGPVEKV